MPIYSMRTRLSRTLDEWVGECLVTRQIPPELWPRPEIADVELVAFVDHGRWLSECPGCKAGMYVDLDDLRAWCALCCNAYVDYRYVTVVMPANRKEIEVALDDGRPEDSLTWRAGMSVEDVAAGKPAPAPLPPHETLVTLAEAAGAARDEALATIEAIRRDFDELAGVLHLERTATLGLIRRIEQLRTLLDQERAFGKAMAETVAPGAHVHEN